MKGLDVMIASGEVHQKLDYDLATLWITIDNPGKHNAMTADMVRQVSAGIRSIAYDNDIRSVVISGVGDDLTSGSDASESFDYFRTMPGGNNGPVPSQRSRLLAQEQLWWGPEGLYGTIQDSPKLVMLEAKGYCLEIGLYLALCCDVLIVSPDACFGNPRWSYLGADGDISMLVLALGLKHAKEMMFLGRQFSGQEAVAWGLVDRTVPKEELHDACVALARACKSIYRDGIVAGKAYLRASLGAMQVQTGFSYATIMGAVTSNIMHREGELNFVKTKRDAGTSAAIRLGREFYAPA
jgi:enoyl-CoA hydratase